ncbi:cytochrome c oxidase assembly factor CtaG [Gracilibacillus salitolerans]|uniref:Cytochrome c oxidase assembly factor CtaG n=1 Tax=Gracilibacillus salitolerans TaxID=2663022 RepID=A0A5Q2THR3_9BACI|nr:cytochrome c oxidase assembly factor CtaG [Gracilibacillus salitolerans]QGH34399.1 cytochrome c oxidase assembly factor CtaG [Gracilibacillus salitolerans]
MWQDLQIFGFRALWSPYYVLFILSLAVLYYLFFINRKDNKKADIKQIYFFYSGLILLYIIKGSPVDLLSHIMFTAHMIQMALYYLLFPILIIKGIPLWVWKKVFQITLIGPILQLLTKPLIALLLFNGLFSIYHIPLVFDFAKANELAHALITLTILFAAFIVWWPIFTPIKEMNTMSPLLKIGYIAANGILITPACALIIFATTSIYTTYSATGGWVQALALCVPSDVLSGLSLSGPEMFSPLGMLEDQQLGGIIMKITQEIIYGAILARIFFPWFRSGADKIDPLPSNQHTEQI